MSGSGQSYSGGDRPQRQTGIKSTGKARSGSSASSRSASTGKEGGARSAWPLVKPSVGGRPKERSRVIHETVIVETAVDSPEGNLLGCLGYLWISYHHQIMIDGKVSDCGDYQIKPRKRDPLLLSNRDPRRVASRKQIRDDIANNLSGNSSNNGSVIMEPVSVVLQGSVLRPVLYSIFTADLPALEDCFDTTFSDETAILDIIEDDVNHPDDPGVNDPGVASREILEPNKPDQGGVGTEITGNELEASFPPAQPPQFATENSTLITAQIGSTALLPCLVHNIGDGVVSWIRRKDYHLLTVGLTTYTGDERYQAVHLHNSEDWTLQIKFVQERDAGMYECQVSSHPPASIFLHLEVVEARAEIAGPREKYLKLGSVLRLLCTLRQSPEPPIYMFWYHNNRMVNYDLDRGINVTSELSAKSSTLLVSSATPGHSGNYSCVPSNAQPASTFVHILNGENPAAMQTGGRDLSWLRCPSLWLLVTCLGSLLQT
ncbi:uncharacterized protein LOC142321180 [Lycorma delicatula]|uniref:uncharacterized protein LOC142321180 n=1 Tax=Lycorma delicatula TaxID=130591 RepID=UPI003F512E52